MELQAETEDTQNTRLWISVFKALSSVGEKFLEVKKYSLFLAFTLMGIWCVGRVIEALTGNAVFEPVLIGGMAL
ncbi:MAG: hypothetical protein ACOC6E_02430 [Thermodesulfobacteriota bacterium]